MIMYDFNANDILCAPLKNRQAKTITEAWESLHSRTRKHGHETKNFILDNECSNDLKLALKKNKKNYELNPKIFIIGMLQNALYIPSRTIVWRVYKF